MLGEAVFTPRSDHHQWTILSNDLEDHSCVIETNLGLDSREKPTILAIVLWVVVTQTKSRQQFRDNFIGGLVPEPYEIGKL